MIRVSKYLTPNTSTHFHTIETIKSMGADESYEGKDARKMKGRNEGQG
jgi:hypothetical protein